MPPRGSSATSNGDVQPGAPRIATRSDPMRGTATKRVSASRPRPRSTSTLRSCTSGRLQSGDLPFAPTTRAQRVSRRAALPERRSYLAIEIAPGLLPTNHLASRPPHGARRFSGGVPWPTNRGRAWTSRSTRHGDAFGGGGGLFQGGRAARSHCNRLQPRSWNSATGAVIGGFHVTC